jgi:aspartate/methionine/tyrosine aminotransferase
MVATFRDRRDLLMKGLQDLPGLSCDRPEGAFYAFVDARERGPGSGELAHRLLEEGGVAAVSGADFGPRGEGFLRLSLTRDAARIAEAVARLRNLLGA